MIALVVAGADCVWQDIEGALEIVEPDITVAVNDIGAYYEPIDHWVSLHPDKFRHVKPFWCDLRAENGLHDDYSLWTKVWPYGVREERHKWVDGVTDHYGGSSTMLGVEVAVNEVGATQTILCGAPLEETPHFHGFKEGAPWPHADAYRDFWTRREVWLKTKNVTSMSGWTRRFLGAPDGA